MYKYLSRWRAELMGIAALLIVLYHARAEVPLKLWTHVVTNNGNMGVDIFFFLSGFGCVCSLRRNPEIRQYYSRRMKRLLPAYYVGIALQTIVVGIPSAQLLAACLLPIGVWTGQTTGYWYISACVLFYLLIPLMLSALDRASYPRACLAAMMLFAAVVLPIATRDAPPARAVMRLPALIAGTGMGFFWQGKRGDSQRWTGAIPLAVMYVAGLILMLRPGFLSGAISRIYRPQQLDYMAKSLRAPLLTLLAAMALEGISRTPLRQINRVLRYLGTLSLEIYVGHEVVKAMAVEWLGLSGLKLMALLVLLCVPSALLVKLLAQMLSKGVARLSRLKSDGVRI